MALTASTSAHLESFSVWQPAQRIDDNGGHDVHIPRDEALDVVHDERAAVGDVGEEHRAVHKTEVDHKQEVRLGERHDVQLPRNTTSDLGRPR
jgi:hypothetical protein